VLLSGPLPGRRQGAAVSLRGLRRPGSAAGEGRWDPARSDLLPRTGRVLRSGVRYRAPSVSSKRAVCGQARWQVPAIPFSRRAERGTLPYFSRQTAEDRQPGAG
jgi:hypothetical protein